MKTNKNTEIVIYQTKSGSIEFRTDIKQETIWATQAQMASVFGINPQAITKHLKNIYQEGELTRSATCSKMEQVQREVSRKVSRTVEIYNLDAIISVGYRISSGTGTKFRQWATKTLREHIVNGYTINKKRLAKNYGAFLQAVEDMKKLLPAGGSLDSDNVLELIKLFASTWLSLEAYDREALPSSGAVKKQVNITAEQLQTVLASLKQELVAQKNGNNLFGVERKKGSVIGIVGNVFQSFAGKDLYPTLEEKAAHLLYFIVKDHPFVDGNKRNGAFAFIWFLRKAGLLNIKNLSPEALTALTLLVAESDPKDKARIIGLVLMLLRK
ncbi:MAG: virulence protein RhuM/Fic/DOC family protein [Candidatus Margulisiibacteriota bacterium]|jgi:death-on-curing family protein